MNRKTLLCTTLTTVLTVALLIMTGDLVTAQTPLPVTPTGSTTDSATVPATVPSPSPTLTLVPANVLLVYDKTSLALINISQAPLSLVGMSFMRGGGVIKYNVNALASTLAPGHCIQWWVATVNQVLGKPPECGVRDRYARLTKDTTYFWVTTYATEPFRPQLNNSTLFICVGSAGRCTFNLPQADAAKTSWTVLDPQASVPLPAGIQVAYDANQMWIGNFTPDTLLTTAALRVFYTVNQQGQVWTPSGVIWDGMSAWDGRALAAGQCLVMYQDASKITPLLPCIPIAQTMNADHPWTLAFDVMGPREERHSPCGAGTPITGPVLCLLAG